jgi:hypothetical protein
MMLQLKLENKIFIEQIKARVDAVKQLASSSVTQEIAKAAFAVLGERFVKDLDRESIQNPKKFHHVYEWGRLGTPDGRLFVLEREGILNGNLSIRTNFLPSNVPVPTRNTFTRSINTTDIFRYKADVMEKGLPVSFVAQKVLSFMGAEGQAFVAPGTRINIMNPGGIASKNAFSDFMISWYVQHTNAIMDSSGLYERIANETAAIITANGSITDVRRQVASIVNSMGGNVEVIQ